MKAGTAGTSAAGTSAATGTDIAAGTADAELWGELAVAGVQSFAERIGGWLSIG